MQLREPVQKLLAETHFTAGSGGGIEIIRDVIKYGGGGEIDSREAPHEDEQYGPYSQETVQGPIEFLEAGADLNSQAAAPFIGARPPDDDSSEGYQDQKNASGGINVVASF